MADSGKLDRVTTALYDAAADPSVWPRALLEVTRLCGATGAQFLIWNNRANAMELSTLVGFDPQAEVSYGAYYESIDPRRRLIGTIPVGRVLACHEHFDDGFVRRSEFYNGFLIPCGSRYVAGARLIDSTEQTVVIALHRAAPLGPFEPDDRAVVETLVPHLRWAAEVRRRLAPVFQGGQLARATLDGLAAAVVVADAERRARFVNRAAEAVIAQRDGLSVRQGRLVASEPDTDAALNRLLAQASATGRARGTVDPSPLAMPRPSGRRAYVLLAVPLPERTSAADLGAAVLVHVVDPETEGEPRTTVLRRLFGLTAAEAELAVELARGRRLEEVAAERGVQLTTVRSQLQSLFAKMETNHQAELVRLLTRLVALGAGLPVTRSG